jgi:hypothetical protein
VQVLISCVASEAILDDAIQTAVIGANPEVTVWIFMERSDLVPNEALRFGEGREPSRRFDPEQGGDAIVGQAVRCRVAGEAIPILLHGRFGRHSYPAQQRAPLAAHGARNLNVCTATEVIDRGDSLARLSSRADGKSVSN